VVRFEVFQIACLKSNTIVDGDTYLLHAVLSARAAVVMLKIAGVDG
jgi:hypothetical protein